jgi:hypothetical protein
MKDLLSVIRPFNLEVLICLVMLVSMAVGTVCIGGYRLVVATLSRIRLLTAWSRTSEPAPHQLATTTDVPRHGSRCEGSIGAI